MTTTASSDTPTVIAAAQAAAPGSLAAELNTGARAASLLFPGIDATWPAVLAESLVGRPDLRRWLEAVVADLDAWSREPRIRGLGLFADGFAHLMPTAGEAAAHPRAGTAPHALLGSLLTNLVSLAGLEQDGLHVGAQRGKPRATGHSAGLLAAVVATARGDDGLVPVAVAADAARVAAIMGAHAARHPWAVSDSAVAAAMGGEESAGTPMVAISGPRTARLADILSGLGAQDDVAISVVISRTRHVLAGDPKVLREVHDALQRLAQAEATERAAGQLGGTPFRFAWEPIASAVPFHHPSLAGAARAAVAHARELGLSLPPLRGTSVLDPASGRDLPSDGTLDAVVHSVLARPHDWARAVVDTVPEASVGVLVSPLGGMAAVSAGRLRGRGALLIDPSTPAGRSALFTAGSAPAVPETYARFAPRPVRAADGSLRLDNLHTRRSGRSPMILPGMTPSTVEAPIVVAAANGGHVAELAGGGQVTERIFTERIAELSEGLADGQEVVVNSLYLDPYLWNLQVGRERLVQRARAAGAPINGVTISAGIPDKVEALGLLDELAEAGIWLNAFKPGTVAQVQEVLAIAGETSHTVWIHLEGGTAGGHHSWEDLDELLLSTYHLIRAHDNVVLAVGGGVADPDRAAALLSGSWAHSHAAPSMPVDAILLGTVTMATKESGASASVKHALVQAAGHDGWVGRGRVAGGTTSGRSGLNADIHFLDNSASRAAALLDSVAGDAEAVAAQRTSIIDALAATAKPYFGDVADMTYAEMLQRFCTLTALGRHGRYEDGPWLDVTHRVRYQALLQQAEARLDPADEGSVPTLFADLRVLDDPQAALQQLIQAHPSATTALLHPADVAHFLSVARMPGKPVPFVPVIDADVRRWYQSDSLWQSHSDLYDADQVLIIPGPVAVSGITAADEPVAELLDRFEAAVAERLLSRGQQAAELPTIDHRLAHDPDRTAAPGSALLAAALQAPTWLWLQAHRPNPLHRIGDPGQWTVEADTARCSTAPGEQATLSVSTDGSLVLSIRWPDLGLPGDGQMVLPVEVQRQAGVVTFAVTEPGLDEAGSALLRMFASGTAAPVAEVELAAAHAATVGAAAPLPDRHMSTVWPVVFGALADSGLAPAIFDLVHLRHEIELAAVGEGPQLPAGAPRAAGPEVARTDGGLIVTISSGTDTAHVVDRFFVRRAVVDADLAVAEARPQRPDVVPTPTRTLGTLTVTAPSRLEAFATVSGDANPIHRSDTLARFVGLPGRIVHGMWTSAAATRAVLESAAGGDAGRLRDWQVDFVAPVHPGQEVTFTVTRTGMRAGATVVGVEANTADGLVAMGSAVVAGPRTVYVFPGQGIQSQGMGMDGYARSRAAREVWDRADATTRERMGFSILQIVRDNPPSIDVSGRTYRHPGGVLHLTQFTQVAMATLAMATVAEMRAAGVFDPTAAVAGHSVGEYNALGASNGVLSLEAAVELVYARGLGMHGLVRRDADGRSEYGLAVIRPHLAGLSHAEAERLVNSVAADTGELCEIVNHNLRGKQYAVAGTLVALATLEQQLGAGRPGRVPMLMVPGIDVPFHSSALRDGVRDFRTQLRNTLPEHIDAEGLVGRYIPNLYPHVFRIDRQYVQGVYEACGSPVLAELLADWDAASADPGALARCLLVELLAWQFASPVRWIETFELMCAPVSEGGLGIERVVEIGVGSAPTLANLAKGSLALSSHRGTRPDVHNVEVDAEAVFQTDEDVVVAESVDAEEVDPQPTPPVPPAPMPGAPSAAAAVEPTAVDLPVDHATAVAALLALRVGVRVEQLEHDSVESLVDGASSRRNQVLMDIGKEFAVSAIDGAHEVPLVELTRTLAERSAGYRYPGPVLSAAVDGALTAALGPRGASASAVAKRVSSHWGLGPGWVDRATLALALGTREGTSRRGGDLATLTDPGVEELIDAAVLAAAGQAGVTVAPAAAAATGAGTVDAAAVDELREHVEGILVDQASEVLARLGKVVASDPLDAEYREALSTVALLEAEHGPAALVAPAFDARRHVLLDSASTWARADVDHLVQAALAAETAVEGRPGESGEQRMEDLIEQIAVHREHDPRIARSLHYHRRRLTAAGRSRTVDVLDRALSAQPAGVAVPEADVLRAALGSGQAGRVLEAAETLARRPGGFAGDVALVTGASPNSIAWSTLAHLLRGGATVVVATTTDTAQRIAAYRDLERRYAAPGAQLHIVRANLASFADIDALVEWMVTPTTEEVGPVTREVKPALWPTLVLPFAAAPAMGELPDTGPQAELTLRLLLLGVQRLVGTLAERAAAAGRARFSVILPLSPNHGTFGGDGAYGDAKAALTTLANKWRSEGSRWGTQTGIIGAEIGWVRGTGLMAGNDPVARYVEDELGVLTYSAPQMGALVAALATPEFRAAAERAPQHVDLSGGLAGRDDLATALAGAVAESNGGAATPEVSPWPTVAALPNLPEEMRTARAAVRVPRGPSQAKRRAEDMIVMVGVAEYGPWGAASTRWQAETGRLSAGGVVELAWRCGLLDWDGSAGTWVDAETSTPVAEAELAARYREPVEARCGVRLLEDDELVDASGYPEFTEVFLDRPMVTSMSSEAEARAMAADTPGASVARSEDGWILTLPSGAPVRVPRRRALLRSVGGQFPTGSDPVRVGLDAGAAASMDHLTAWNVAITAEALADAGVTPEELVACVHPSLVGNTQGSGMGGMDSIAKVFMGPLTGRQSANDVLQEALGNVVAAHVNQGLVGGYGPMVHPVAACATAAVSLEEAVDKIALGKAEIIIGGGWDDLSTEGITGFANMAATADNAMLLESGLAPDQHSRPGDRRRRGFVESQGGGSFVICRGSVALALGLPVRAVVGYAASFGDGVHTSIPAPGLGALGAVRGGADSPLGRALADLGLEPDDLAVVSKHDTSTEANDPNEAFVHETIQRELGRTPGAPLRVVSQKSLTGHSKGGAAAWQIAGLCDVFRTATVPGNRNLTSADPRVTPGEALVVDYRNLHRAEPVRAALVTSLGFGHVSAVVALAHPDVFVEAIGEADRDEYVQRAHRRRVAAARAGLTARHGGQPLMRRRTDRRLGAGAPVVLREREAAMLVDADGGLPGAATLGSR